MKRWAIRIWRRLRGLRRRWEQLGHEDHAAALSFYALVSLAPLLFCGVTLAGMVLGERVAHGQLEKQLTAVVGEEAAKAIEGVIQSVKLSPGTDLAAFAVAMVSFLYAGSHVLSKLRGTLNRVFDVGPQDPSRRWLGRLAARLLSASLLMAFGVLLVVSTVAESVAAFLARTIEVPWGEEWHPVRKYQEGSSYLLLFASSLLILKILPRRRPGWLHAAAGALVAAVLVGSLKRGLDEVLRHTLWASFAGGGLAVMVFLFWLYLSTQAFLLGAEIAAWLGRRAQRKKAKGGQAPSTSAAELTGRE